MKAFEAALEKNLLPWLKNVHLIKRNVRLGVSVLDYLLEKRGNLKRFSQGQKKYY